MISHVGNLIRWEWFKTRRRQMPWILLVIPVPFTQLTLWSTHFSYKAPEEARSPPSPGIWACGNSLTITLTWAARRGGPTPETS